MLNLSELKSPKGTRKKRKMVGRGSGSGHGKTSTRGHKGQMSRSGKGKRPGFEGGQMSLIRRVPKRGFTSKFKKEYQLVNLESLNKVRANSNVGPQELYDLGIIRKKNIPVKILGNGELKKAVTVQAHKFSRTAQKAIEEQGGKTIVLNSITGKEADAQDS